MNIFILLIALALTFLVNIQITIIIISNAYHLDLVGTRAADHQFRKTQNFALSSLFVPTYLFLLHFCLKKNQFNDTQTKQSMAMTKFNQSMSCKDKRQRRKEQVKADTAVAVAVAVLHYTHMCVYIGSVTLSALYDRYEFEENWNDILKGNNNLKWKV